KPVAHERKHNLHMRQFAHPARMRLAEPGQRRCGEYGMDGWRFELVTDRSVRRCRIEEVVGVDRLRGAGESIYLLGHQGGRNSSGMKERAFPDHDVRIRNLASKEQRGCSDRSSGRDESLRAYRDPMRRRICAVCVQADASKRGDTAVRMLELPRA